MADFYLESETIKHKAFGDNGFVAGEYENCTFQACDLSKSSLRDTKFIDCEFDGCDLSMATLVGTVFQDVSFKNCKMQGLHFEDCNDFLLAISFEHCNLKYASFSQMKLKGISFLNCKLEEAAFIETELPKSSFDGCDLLLADFDHCNLENADFRTAVNYSLDPDQNRIANAKFSKEGIAGLLNKYNITIE